jgi:hypothetical protein
MAQREPINSTKGVYAEVGYLAYWAAGVLASCCGVNLAGSRFGVAGFWGLPVLPGLWPGVFRGRGFCGQWRIIRLQHSLESSFFGRFDVAQQ